jgi:DNA-binding transcriptional LysR family regulator
LSTVHRTESAPWSPLADSFGRPPRVGLFCDDWNGKLALVAAGAGVTLVPTLAQPAVRPDVVLRPVLPALPMRRLFAAVPEPQYRTPAVTAILRVLASAAARRTRT